MDDNKITTEDEKKLDTLMTHITSINSIMVADDTLENQKTRMTYALQNLIIPLGTYILSTQKNKDRIDDVLSDKIHDDLYENDPLYPNVINYIDASESRFLMQEQVNNVLCEFIVQFLKTFNDIMQSQPIKDTKNTLTDDGQPRMSDEERATLKRNVTSLAIYWKNCKKSLQKNIVDGLIRKANTAEKYNFIQDIFFEVTKQEKVLDDYSKEVNPN